MVVKQKDVCQSASFVGIRFDSSTSCWGAEPYEQMWPFSSRSALKRHTNPLMVGVWKNIFILCLYLARRKKEQRQRHEAEATGVEVKPQRHKRFVDPPWTDNTLRDFQRLCGTRQRWSPVGTDSVSRPSPPGAVCDQGRFPVTWCWTCLPLPGSRALY